MISHCIWIKLRLVWILLFCVIFQDYTNLVCWVSNTYYVPFDHTLPKQHEPREMISYYQWVPIILLCQAWMYFLPCIIWRFLNRRIGLNLCSIIEAAQSVQKAIYVETKEKTLRYMVLQIDSYLMRQHKSKKGACGRVMQTLAQYCCLFCGRFYGNYLTATYLLTKVLYIINSIAQLFLLDIFLGFRNNYHMYGIQVLMHLFTGHDWSSSERFPRVTMCDFQIRQQTNVHNYSLQCVLPINLFNEKIFIFIWFWLLLVTLTSIMSLIHWLMKSVVLPMQVSYVKRQLRAMDLLDKRESKNVKRFTEQYLRRDGIFIIRMVAKNAGDLVTAELIHGLWINFGPDRRATAAETYNDIARRRKAARPISQEIVWWWLRNSTRIDCLAW